MSDDILLVLSILQARHLPSPQGLSVLAEAKYNYQILQSDPVPLTENADFNTELVWETDRRSLQQHRLHKTPVKVEFYATCTEAGDLRQLLGYVVLDTRSAREELRSPDGQHTVQWQRVLGCRPRSAHEPPAVQLGLCLEPAPGETSQLDHQPPEMSDTSCSVLEVPAAPSVADEAAGGAPGGAPPNYQVHSPPTRGPSALDNVDLGGPGAAAAGEPPLTPRLDNRRGCFQLGDPAAPDQEMFTLTVIVVYAQNLELLLPAGVESLPTSCDGFSFFYSLLDCPIVTEPFGSLVRPQFLAERAVTRLRCPLPVLQRYLRRVHALDLHLCCGDLSLGSASVPLLPLYRGLHAPPTKPLLSEAAHALRSSVTGQVPRAGGDPVSGRTPAVGVALELAPARGSGDGQSQLGGGAAGDERPGSPAQRAAPPTGGRTATVNGGEHAALRSVGRPSEVVAADAHVSDFEASVIAVDCVAKPSAASGAAAADAGPAEWPPQPATAAPPGDGTIQLDETALTIDVSKSHGSTLRLDTTGLSSEPGSPEVATVRAACFESAPAFQPPPQPAEAPHPPRQAPPPRAEASQPPPRPPSEAPHPPRPPSEAPHPPRAPAEAPHPPRPPAPGASAPSSAAAPSGVGMQPATLLRPPAVVPEKRRHYRFVLDLRKLCLRRARRGRGVLKFSYPLFGDTSELRSGPVPLTCREPTTVPGAIFEFNFAATPAWLAATLGQFPVEVRLETEQAQAVAVAHVPLLAVTQQKRRHTTSSVGVSGFQQTHCCTVPLTGAEGAAEAGACGQLTVAMSLDDLGEAEVGDTATPAAPAQATPAPPGDNSAKLELEMYAAARELEQWKQEQKLLFQNQLQQREAAHLATLTEQWKRHDAERELQLQRRLRDAAALEDKLRGGLATLEERQRTLQQREDELAELRARLQAEHQQIAAEVRALTAEMDAECQKRVRAETRRADDAQTARKRAEQERADGEARLAELQSRLAAAEQPEPAAVLELERRLQAAMKSKLYYKQRWAETARELEDRKAADTRLARDRLEREKLELDKLRAQLSVREETHLLADERRLLDELRGQVRALTPRDAPAAAAGAADPPPATASSGEQLRRLREERQTLIDTGMYTAAEPAIRELDGRIGALTAAAAAAGS